LPVATTHPSRVDTLARIEHATSHVVGER